MFWEIAVVATLAALTVGRVMWEKRSNRPEPESEAVGGWIGDPR